MEKGPTLAHGILLKSAWQGLKGRWTSFWMVRTYGSRIFVKFKVFSCKRNQKLGNKTGHQWGTVKKTLGKEGCTDLVMHNLDLRIDNC